MNGFVRIHYSLLLTLQAMSDAPWWRNAVQEAAPYVPWVPVVLLALGYLAGIVGIAHRGLLVNVVCPALTLLCAVVAALSSYRLSQPAPPIFDAVAFAVSFLVMPLGVGIPLGVFVRSRRFLLIITSFLLFVAAVVWVVLPSRSTSVRLDGREYLEIRRRRTQP